jgi:hypothetical protein
MAPINKGPIWAIERMNPPSPAIAPNNGIPVKGQESGRSWICNNRSLSTRNLFRNHPFSIGRKLSEVVRASVRVDDTKQT